MKFDKLKLQIVFLTLFFLTMDCGPGRTFEIVDNKIVDNQYDNHPPFNDSSPKISRIMSSIAMINCTAYYKQYEFDPEDKVYKEDVTDADILKKGDNFNISRNSAGTSLLLSISGNKVLLLTCNHIIDYPEETYDYYSKYFSRNYVNIFLKKQKQTQFVTLDNNVVDLEIIAQNKRKDIALLGGTSSGKVMNISEPDFKIGNASDLNTGNFVYIFGFPKGHKMVSSGLISMEGSRTDQFMMDIPFNRGMSGGIVFAIRDDSPNFEMIGMATSAAADFEYILTPEEEIIQDEGFNQSLPYQGNIYIEEKPRIRYGITYVNSIEVIMNFLRRNRRLIENAGYDIDHILGEKE
ncbi:MAG: serine protease [Candidatus Marinimicrobia bacterium]|nr:serine protease [Candidatus Neomarinimicrobiota bacterium]